MSKPGDLVLSKVPHRINDVQASFGQEIHGSPPANFWPQG